MTSADLLEVPNSSPVGGLGHGLRPRSWRYVAAVRQIIAREALAHKGPKNGGVPRERKLHQELILRQQDRVEPPTPHSRCTLPETTNRMVGCVYVALRGGAPA